MAEPLHLDGPHWSFALRVYRQPGVAEACLMLQDHHGVDVNVLLLALFAAVDRGILLDRAALEEVDRLVRPWRDEVVVPLRQVRRRLKSGPMPAPDAQTEALRNAVKAAELQAEQIEEALLACWLESRAAGRTDAPIDLQEVVWRVAALGSAKGGHVQLGEDDLRRAVRIIAAAAAVHRATPTA